jgi:YVTN family beta-propeller protein
VQVSDALGNDPLLRVVFIIREDYLAQLDPFAMLLPESLRSRFRLERLRKDAAFKAVKGPLEKAKGHVDEAKIKKLFDEGVIDKLIGDLVKIRVETFGGQSQEVKGEFVEPIQLQVVCQRLWNKLRSSQLDQINQDFLGDIDKALELFYVEAIREASKRTGVSEDVIRIWFDEKLITSSVINDNKIYVANQGSSTISVIDGNRDQVVKTLPINPTNNRLQSVAVDSKTHLLYLGLLHDDGTGSISILNQTQYNDTYIQVSQSPIDMDFNAKTSELYVAELDNKSVAVIDTKADTLKRDISLGESNLPFNIAVNPNSSKKYVANIDPGNNNSSIVSVISGKDDDILKNVSLPFHVFDIAIDPSLNKIYVTGSSKNHSYLAVIDGQNDTAMNPISLSFSPSYIAVNPNSNNIYLANNKDWSIAVMEAKDDNILNNTSNISLTISPESIVVDPAVDRIYVTSYSKPSLSKQESFLDPRAIGLPKLTQIQVINGSNHSVWWNGQTMKLDPRYGDILLSFDPENHDLLATSPSTDTIQSWNIPQAQKAIEKTGGILYGVKQESSGIDYTQLAINKNGNKLYIANPTLNAIKVQKVENVSHRVF